MDFKLDFKSIDAMPAGRGMDALIHTLVLKRKLTEVCVLRPEPEGSFSPEQCRICGAACLLPRCSTDWAEIPGVVSSLNKQDYLLYLNQTPSAALLGAWEALIVHREIPPASYLWDAGWHACGQDAPEAIGRAVLKWAIERRRKEL